MGEKSLTRELVELVEMDTIADIHAAELAGIKIDLILNEKFQDKDILVPLSEIEKMLEETYTDIKEQLIAVTEKKLLEIFSENEIAELVEIHRNPLMRKLIQATGENVAWLSKATISIEKELLQKEMDLHQAMYHADNEEVN